MHPNHHLHLNSTPTIPPPPPDWENKPPSSPANISPSQKKKRKKERTNERSPLRMLRHYKASKHHRPLEGEVQNARSPLFGGHGPDFGRICPALTSRLLTLKFQSCWIISCETSLHCCKLGLSSWDSGIALEAPKSTPRQRRQLRKRSLRLFFILFVIQIKSGMSGSRVCFESESLRNRAPF